jgi:hypothetical protein
MGKEFSKLKQAALDAASHIEKKTNKYSWYTKSCIGWSSGGVISKTDARFIEIASPVAILDLFKRLERAESTVRMRQAHAQTLQEVGTALGLTAGTDLHKATVPAIRLLVDGMAAKLAALKMQPGDAIQINANSQYTEDDLMEFGTNLAKFFGHPVIMVPDGVGLLSVDAPAQVSGTHTLEG